MRGAKDDPFRVPIRNAFLTSGRSLRRWHCYCPANHLKTLFFETSAKCVTDTFVAPRCSSPKPHLGVRYRNQTAVLESGERTLRSRVIAGRIRLNWQGRVVSCSYEAGGADCEANVTGLNPRGWLHRLYHQSTNLKTHKNPQALLKKEARRASDFPARP